MRPTHQTHSNRERPRAGRQLWPENTLPPQEVGRHTAQRTLNTPSFTPSPLTPHRHCTATITQPRDSEKNRAVQQRLPLAPRCCCSHAAPKRSAATQAKSLPPGAGVLPCFRAGSKCCKPAATAPPSSLQLCSHASAQSKHCLQVTAFLCFLLGSTLPKASTTALPAVQQDLLMHLSNVAHEDLARRAANMQACLGRPAASWAALTGPAWVLLRLMGPVGHATLSRQSGPGNTRLVQTCHPMPGTLAANPSKKSGDKDKRSGLPNTCYVCSQRAGQLAHPLRTTCQLAQNSALSRPTAECIQ
jgi:hypothetical protein